MKLLALAFAAFLATQNTEALDWSGVIAQVDGRLFFAFPEAPLLTWFEAKTFCEAKRMGLAQISTEAQWDAFDTAGTNSTSIGNYWISGRDAQEIRQFTWDYTGGGITVTNRTLVPARTITYQTCLGVTFKSLGKVVLNYDTCLTKKGAICDFQIDCTRKSESWFGPPN